MQQTAQSLDDGTIVTVTGEIPASQLGATLSHEHLYCDVSAFSGKADNRLTVPDQVIADLDWYRRAGGR